MQGERVPAGLRQIPVQPHISEGMDYSAEFIVDTQESTLVAIHHLHQSVSYAGEREQQQYCHRG
jgi:hypothetical protein